MLVYRITNTENNKSYVGITTRNIERRWYEHKYVPNSCGQLLSKAINKYGESAFVIEHIASAIGNVENLKELEKQLIEQCGTMVPNGYNLTAGGDGMFGFKHTEESKQAMSKAKIGKPSSLLGYKHTETAKRNMSEAHKGLPGNTKGKPSPLKGIKRSEEVCRKISETKRQNRLLKLETIKGSI